MHPLIRISDDIDHAILRASRAVAKRKPEAAVMPTAYERACRRFLAPSPTLWPDGCYKFISEAESRQIKGAHKKSNLTPQDQDKAFRNAEGAAFERWLGHTCPYGDVESVQRQWLASDDRADFMEGYLEAVVRPKHKIASPWRKCRDIPEVERVGLWFWRAPGLGAQSLAKRANQLLWRTDIEYRPAPDDAKNGDAYDELRYWQPNTGVQPVADGMRVDVCFGTAEEFRGESADVWCWKDQSVTGAITHWRLSRVA